MMAGVERCLELKRLEYEGFLAYESLTYQHVRRRLLSLEDNTNYLLLGAELVAGSGSGDEFTTGLASEQGSGLGSTSGPEPVGLIVLQLHSGYRTAEVVSLLVKAKYRRLGIGTALLLEAESILREAGFTSIRLVYYAGKAITPILENFLLKHHWSQPTLEGKVYKADIRIAQAPWLKKIELPQGMSSFFWRDLSEAEQLKLRDSGNPKYPEFLSPFKSNMELETSNCLGLSVQGNVVGWCMTYRIADDTILYDSVYVDEPFRLYGCAFILMAQSILIQLEQQVPFAMFAVNVKTPSMLRMVDRRLAPYTFQISEKKAATKLLIHPGGAAR